MRMEGQYVYGDDMYVPDYIKDSEWESMPEYPGYVIGSCGEVWSEKSQKFLKAKPLDKKGHLGFCFSVNGKDIYVYLARLLAKAFIPNPYNLPIVRHLNDNPIDNELENLAWGTQKDNHEDSVRNGNAKYPTDAAREKGFQKTRIPVLATNIDTGEKIPFNSQSFAARELSLQQANIWKVLNGERAHCGRWNFRYLTREEYEHGDY